MSNVRRSLECIKDVSLALGFFDGVHLAHRKLISKAVSYARENGLKSALITYSKPPFAVIKKIPPEYIFPLDDRISQIEALGVDEIFVLDFEQLKNLTAQDYIQKVLIPYFSPKLVVSGFNHTFGLNKKGNSGLLSENFNYYEISPQTIDGLLISSSNIKHALKAGNIELANKMLGRNFYTAGKVVRGAQIARKLGYPTANIIWQDEIVRPKYGVYSGFAEFEGAKFRALINFGVRPTIDRELKETLEVHIENFNGDLYDKTLRVEFIRLIRPEKKFSSIQELKDRIAKDLLEHNNRTS